MDTCGRCKVSRDRVYDMELGNLCDCDYERVLETARECYALIPTPSDDLFFHLLGIGAGSDELNTLLALLRDGVPYEWAETYLTR